MRCDAKPLLAFDRELLFALRAWVGFCWLVLLLVGFEVLRLVELVGLIEKSKRKKTKNKL
jgi:hypothetical protein